MIDKILEMANTYPEKIAYVINDDKITYKELVDYASLYASYLKKQGDKPVIIYGDKDIDVVISIIACLFAKRTYVPVSLNTPLKRLNNIIKLCDASLILSSKKGSFLIECLSLNELNKYKDNLEYNINNNYAYIIFTSGSTGEPKGVPISYDNLNNFINWISNFELLKEYKDINVFNQAQFSFDLSVADFYYALCNGHTLYAYNNKIDDLNNLYNNFINIDLAIMTPTFMKLLLLNKDFNKSNFPKLKCIYFCGEKLTCDLVKKIFFNFKNINIINAYGPTEATSAVSAVVIKDNMLDSKYLPVGKVDSCASKIEILNNEIIIEGKSVSDGYLNDVNGGFFKNNKINSYKTGDIGFIENNYIYCTGRIDNQIKYKGYRIELEEIESILSSFEEIDDAIVKPIYKNEDIIGLKAFCKKSFDVNNIDIKNKLKLYLPKYMIPKEIIFIDNIPINKNGKKDREAL